MNAVRLIVDKENKNYSLGKVTSFLTPKFLYYPLFDGGKEVECLVKPGDKVLIGAVIGKRTGPFPTFIHASCSGKVIKIDEKVWHPSGVIKQNIVIENDFKDEWENGLNKETSKEPTKENIIEAMEKCGIVGMGGGGFPMWAKYKGVSGIDTVVINAVECEPYLTVDLLLAETKAFELVEGIKLAMIAASSKEAVIVFKKKFKEIVEKNLVPKLPKTVKVKYLKNVYPAGFEKYVILKALKRKCTALPCTVGVIVNNVQTIIALYDAFKFNRPVVTKYLTVSGPIFESPSNVLVKMGTLVSELISERFKLKDENTQNWQLLAGGPMTGTAMVNDNFPVIKCLSGITVLLAKDVKEVPCLKCGKCIDVCPIKLSPVIINSAYKTRNNEAVKTLRPDLCIECGLCSYICPSRIDVSFTVKQAKNYYRTLLEKEKAK